MWLVPDEGGLLLGGMRLYLSSIVMYELRSSAVVEPEKRDAAAELIGGGGGSDKLSFAVLVLLLVELFQGKPGDPGGLDTPKLLGEEGEEEEVGAEIAGSLRSKPSRVGLAGLGGLADLVLPLGVSWPLVLLPPGEAGDD